MFMLLKPGFREKTAERTSSLTLSQNLTRAMVKRSTYARARTHTRARVRTPGEQTTARFEKLGSRWKNGTDLADPRK